MSSPIIEVENIGKLYRIGSGKKGGSSMRDEVARWLSPSRRRARAEQSMFWALDDVSFRVQEGDAVGIIGRNGAGKSTLLKVLSQITPPTRGKITMRGRVASLLEVGTGFHPELTGRENVYLNGAILGMTRGEISRKFDAIVAFAEVERFLDTPVKRYSSGMYVRLAFAVAAHLEAEILVVDEVLAVGDSTFQQKCLDKMGDVTKRGRTVLFVSHNMSAVDTLCSRAVLIDAGRVVADGKAGEVIGNYLQSMRGAVSMALADRTDRSGKGGIRFYDIEVEEHENGESGTDIIIRASVASSYSHSVRARLALSIRTVNEVGLISCDSLLKGETYVIPGSCKSKLACRICSPPLNQGDYYVNIALYNGGEVEDWIVSAAEFSVGHKVFDGRVGTNAFPVLSRFSWSVEEEAAEDGSSLNGSKLAT
ncbi:MAG: ABC transporter ATP-binding protein [Armatimonadota bacterium]